MSGVNKDRTNNSNVNLEKYIDQSIRVKFNGGREVEGVLKGQDMLLNLVLDNAKVYNMLYFVCYLLFICPILLGYS